MNDTVVGARFRSRWLEAPNGPPRVDSLVEWREVGRFRLAWMSEGEAAHLGWVLAHLVCVRWRVRVVRTLMSLKPAGEPGLKGSRT
jgi:hypothetical protein